ncbi:unnamed protein product [Macrosiphum euphorbiae]|uniref:Uncharacterized protein n=1 Tax=Macrosiphum euphorbiae TaxID=13131 RepID=A0AAV0XEQ0_9HEMI|nr:unnamed protein product [Macrosiphum euphorbiae]
MSVIDQPVVVQRVHRVIVTLWKLEGWCWEFRRAYSQRWASTSQPIQPGNCMNVAAESAGLTNVFLYSATESPKSHLTIIFPTRQRPNVPCARYTTTGIRRSAVGATRSAAVLARGVLDALHFVPRDPPATVFGLLTSLE